MVQRRTTIDLVGSAATGIDTNSTGNNYDAAFRVPIPRQQPELYDTGYVVWGTDLSTTGTLVYSVYVRNVTNTANLASQTGLSSAETGDILRFDLSDVADNDKLGMRLNVGTATGSAGSTADLSAVLVLEG